MSDDEKKSLNGGEGDPEEAKLVSELLKKKGTKPTEAGNKNIFSKKLFGTTPAPTSQPKTPSAKPPTPIPPKQTVAQPPKTAPTPRPPQTPPPPAQKPPTPRAPTPVPKPPITQAKPSQPTAVPTAKPSAPPLQPKAPPPPKMATPPPPPPPVQVEEEEEEEVKIVTSEDFDKIGHPTPPAQGKGLKVEGTGTKELVEEEFEEEEDFPELVSPAAPSGTTESVQEEGSAPQLPKEERTVKVEEATPAPAQVSEAVSVSEPVSWELESPVDESAPLEELAAFVVTSKPVTEEIPLKPEREPVVLKAAKDKEGPSAIEETKELIEKLDGLDEGFLDVAEVKRGLKLLEELALKVKELEERLSALEKSKK